MRRLAAPGKTSLAIHPASRRSRGRSQTVGENFRVSYHVIRIEGQGREGTLGEMIAWFIASYPAW